MRDHTLSTSACPTRDARDASPRAEALAGGFTGRPMRVVPFVYGCLATAREALAVTDGGPAARRTVAMCYGVAEGDL